MLARHYPYYLANRPEAPNAELAVTDKYTGQTVCHAAAADGPTLDQAIGAATTAAGAMKDMAPYERRAVLDHCIRRFREQAEPLAQILQIEAGKPIKDSRGEVARLIETFQIAAEESVRIGGEVLNLEISERSKGYRGMYKRVPVGPCGFISPFNFPLNLAAHKIAPAIAAGCPFVLKPASSTPISALAIGAILAETDLPPGAFSILPCDRETAERLVCDDRLKLLSFTGSAEAGWALKAKAGKKKVVLELGGNAACIVDASADLDDAMRRVVFGAFYQSGQSCISVQRLLVHASVYDDFRAKLVAATRQLVSGNPADETVSIGPLISEKAAAQLQDLIDNAVAAGARVLCGGTRNGAILEATLLENVPENHPLQTEEAFGPVAVINRFTDFAYALSEVNRSRYGIHAGVFTRDLPHALRAWDILEVGGVLINEVPSWRVDHLPYGGVKDSGIGREGVRDAIVEMTEIRTLVIRSAP